MFDRATARTTMEKVRAAVEEALKDEGITVKLGNCNFADLTMKIPLNLEMAGEGGETQSSKDFKTYATTFGLKPEWMGKSFKARQTTFTITGLNPNRHTYPVTAVTQNGKRMKLGADMVIAGMGGK